MSSKRRPSSHQLYPHAVEREHQGKTTTRLADDASLLDRDADDFLVESSSTSGYHHPAVRNCANCGKPFRAPPSDRADRKARKS